MAGMLANEELFHFADKSECNIDKELQKLTENEKLFGVFGGNAFAKVSQYHRDGKYEVLITYQRPLLEEMMNVNNLEKKGKIVPKAWLRKGLTYGRLKRSHKEQYDIDKKHLIGAFNHDAYYEIQRKFIEKNKIIDIPYYNKRNFHRWHYIEDWDGKLPCPQEWREASDEYIEDTCIDAFCGICKILQNPR